jgi:hypothetical protein
MPPLDFHGFVSQGFLDSSKYNYLGDTSRGSFLFTEAGLNASMNPFPRTRITAQAFTYDIGQNVGQYDVVLDYATIEYTFNDYIGIRGGRFRRPQGIYNTIQDVDLARTFVLLPQGVYDCTWRDMFTADDGVDLFGNISLSKAGSVSYEAYAGYVTPELNGGLANVFNSSGLHTEEMDPGPQIGGQLWWDTPLDGFRVGAAVVNLRGLDYNFELAPGVTMHQRSVNIEQQYSLEYLWKAWTFQAEYHTFHAWNQQFINGQAIPDGYKEPESWYVAAAYRFNKWFEAGTYYNEYYDDVRHTDGASYAKAANTPPGSTPSDAYQRDLALSLRFDPKPWWILKVEGHWIHGTALVEDDQTNPNRQFGGWFMLALKTTFSF